MKKSKGVWKKERARGRKYSKSDVHRRPAPRTRKKFWIGAHVRAGKKVKGYFKRNPFFKK